MAQRFEIHIDSPIDQPTLVDDKDAKVKVVNVDTAATVRVSSHDGFKGTVYLEYEAQHYDVSAESSVYLDRDEIEVVDVALSSITASPPQSTLHVTGTTSTLMETDDENIPAA